MGNGSWAEKTVFGAVQCFLYCDECSVSLLRELCSFPVGLGACVCIGHPWRALTKHLDIFYFSFPRFKTAVFGIIEGPW